jgi:phage shock protein A
MVAGRFWNFIKGLFWQGQRSLEQANPEAVYEMAIRKMKANYQHMQSAVGKLAAERNRLRMVIEKKQRDLATVSQDLESALAAAQAGDQNAIEIGEELIGEKEALEREIGAVKQELVQSEALVQDYMGKLRTIENQTKQMESRKEGMIAKLHSANARKAFGDMVSGMSTSSEESAVNDIDRHIEGVAAQADIADEMSGQSRDERRRKLRENNTARASQSKFQAMLEARSGGGGAPAREAAPKATVANPADGKRGI